ncbi:MAG: flippase [Patescibacteria group bacterium]
MNHQPVRIAQNTTYLIVAYVVQKIMSFLYFILLARLIGVENIGKYIFALSFTTIFGIFIDLGLSSVLTREIAKDQSKATKYLNNIISTKVILSLLTYLAVVIGINLINKELIVRQMVYLAGLIMVFDSFYLSFYALIRAKQNLKYESIGMMIGQAIIFCSGLLILFLKLPIYYLILAILAGSVFNLFYSYFILRAKFQIKISLTFDKQTLSFLFKIAAPFAIAGIFSRVYGYIDTVLLSTLAGDKAVGWYSAGFKITFALQFIPMAFAAAIFPAMSNYFVTNKELLAKTFERSIYYLTLIALPITFGVVILAQPIIIKMYGVEFAPTAVALQILIFGLIFNFVGTPLSSLLNACNRQITNTINMGITMAVNIALNLTLIPLFGQRAYIGASIAAIVSALIMIILGFYYTNQVISYNKKGLLRDLIKIILATAVMSISIWLLLPAINFILLVPIGGIIYFIILYILKGFDQEEVKKLYYSFVNKEQ